MTPRCPEQHCPNNYLISTRYLRYCQIISDSALSGTTLNNTVPTIIWFSAIKLSLSRRERILQYCVMYYIYNIYFRLLFTYRMVWFSSFIKIIFGTGLIYLIFLFLDSLIGPIVLKICLLSLIRVKLTTLDQLQTSFFSLLSWSARDQLNFKNLFANLK